MYKNIFFFPLYLAIFITMACLSGCTKKKEYPGYIEAEFVYVSTSIAGNLIKLPIEKGQWVAVNQLLYVLDHDNERYAKEEAFNKLISSQYQYKNLTKGKRPDEIEALEMQRKQAVVLMDLSEIEFNRQSKLLEVGGTSQTLFDKAKSDFESNKAKVIEFDAELRLAHLGARVDEIDAAKFTAKASFSSLKEADWRLNQKTVLSPVKAFVQDTLYRQGEWVNAGLPVLVLLPPENLKARFFVPERDLSRIRLNQAVTITCDSCKKPITAHVQFISTVAEFTPPVIFSRESREKLVYLVEAKIPPDCVSILHPGQPIEISFKHR